MKKVPNENILQLRKLSDELCTDEINTKYKTIVLHLKGFLTESSKQLSKKETIKNKVKTYEDTILTFTKILNTIQQ